jgi:hypothetical protein
MDFLTISTLLSWGVGVSSFSVASRRATKSGVDSLRMLCQKEQRSLSASTSPLFSSPQNHSRTSSRDARGAFLANRLSVLYANIPPSYRPRLIDLRRPFLATVFAAVFWLVGAAFYTPSSVASTTTASSTPVERIMSATSLSLDKIVDGYIQEHMFDDDTFDPVESAHREAFADATVGSYPQALRDVTARVLGQESKSLTSTESGEGTGIGSLLTSAVGALQKRGLSESTAIFVLASMFVVAGPCSFLFTGMIIGGMSKRSINRTMKQRYGDTYTVDATMKPEESVEAPDDEEDDDVDEDDDDDDADDDTDQDDDKKSK